MVLNQSFHGVPDNFTEFQFISLAKFGNYITICECNAARKMNRQRPPFTVFANMNEKKVIQSVLNDIFNHVVPSVFGEEQTERCEIPVWQWLFINGF